MPSEPRDKSFDKNARLFDLEKRRAQKQNTDNSRGRSEKVCFNPYCNDKASKLIDIIGIVDDYRDHRIPYCVCEMCFLPFIGWGPGRDYNDSLKSRPNSKTCYYHLCNNEGKHWIDIYKNEIVVDPGWLGLNMKYWLCKSCYAYFEDTRKDAIFLFKKTFYDKIEIVRELGEEHRTAITVEDFCSLLPLLLSNVSQ
jgi:hypothetical protein